jgi:hypothetical protein
MPSFRGEVKPSVPCRRFCSMLKNPAIYVDVGITGHLSPVIPSFMTWSGNKWGGGGTNGLQLYA